MNAKEKNAKELADKLSKKMPTYEIILTIAAITGLTLKISDIQSGTILLTIALLSMAMINAIMAYASIESSLPFDKFIHKGKSMGISVTIIGLLFLLLNWKGSLNMLTVGIITLVVSIAYYLFKKHPIETVLKPLILLAIALTLFLTPKETLQNLHIISNNLIVK